MPARYSPMTSQRTYIHDMTPINSTYHPISITPHAPKKKLTRYLNATPPLMNQNATINPVMPNSNPHVLRAHTYCQPMQERMTGKKLGGRTGGCDGPTRA